MPTIIQRIHRPLPLDHVEVFPNRLQRLAPAALLCKLFPRPSPDILADIIVRVRITCRTRTSEACVSKRV